MRSIEIADVAWVEAENIANERVEGCVAGGVIGGALGSLGNLLLVLDKIEGGELGKAFVEKSVDCPDEKLLWVDAWGRPMFSKI